MLLFIALVFSHCSKCSKQLWTFDRLWEKHNFENTHELIRIDRPWIVKQVDFKEGWKRHPTKDTIRGTVSEEVRWDESMQDPIQKKRVGSQLFNLQLLGTHCDQHGQHPTKTQLLSGWCALRSWIVQIVPIQQVSTHLETRSNVHLATGLCIEDGHQSIASCSQPRYNGSWWWLAEHGPGVIMAHMKAGFATRHSIPFLLQAVAYLR